MRSIIVLRITRPPAEALASGSFGLISDKLSLSSLSNKLKFTGKNPLATLGDGLDGLSRYAVADSRPF